MAKPSQETAKISLGRGDWALQGRFGALLGDPGLRGGLLGHFLTPGARRFGGSWGRLGALSGLSWALLACKIDSGWNDFL